VRGPRPIEIFGAVVVAAVIGVIASRKKHPPPPPPAPVDSGVPLIVDAAGDASVVETEDAFAGYTVDDDDVVDPPEGTTADREKLLALVPMSVRDQATTDRALEQLGPYTNHANQGNPDISKHSISRAQCIAGLKGVVLQTPLQRQICGGPWEVPIHNGDPRKATSCIDVFEYPNHPCVLPFVFSYSILATRLCKLQGKRLCTQEEWNQACETDPSGGPPTKYAYGDKLDLNVCHTGKEKSSKCDVDTALWKSCPTDTVPSGSYPKCKSRLGVYDQHGNVAEAMSRMEKGVNYVQLKGSAWFYDGKIYADDCRFDPRWHVDKVQDSWHTNYHLGFRCCRSIVSLEERGDAGVDAAPILPKPQIDSTSEVDDESQDPYAEDDGGAD
jgi:hypothetical protein